MKKILFTGGGSAGHVVPNIALMQELSRYGTFECAYFGSNGIEKDLIKDLGITFFQANCPKLVRGKNFKTLVKNLSVPIKLNKAIHNAKAILKEFSPDVVFSKGGFVALPLVLAANKLKIPCYTHESDRSIGLANKIISKKCKAVFTSFPETAKTLKNGVFTGAPLRKELFEKDQTTAKIKFGLPLKKKVLLVLGGGSGSKRVNDAVRQSLNALHDFSILHICGKGNLENVNAENYKQFEYLEDIGEAYAAADVVVSRAGAGAIFEILALKKPSVLIPLEGETRGDQLENAEYFASRNLCKVLRQSQLSRLPNAIKEALTDEKMRRALEIADFSRGNEKILSTITGI